ncbi:hypothetical protein [Symmachiella dynata]|uniref:amino acid kinase family protein n=1 Tax=Symmachiella dynata TaxID=2527995 RepID=UPI0030EEBCF7
MPITVFKIGGSLLEVAGLAERIEGLMAQRPETTAVLAVGGGGVADVVRRWDAVHGLGDEAAHWLAVRSLSINEALLCNVLPQCVPVSTPAEAAAHAKAGQVSVLASEAFLRHDEDSSEALPHNWEVTSDSIAARAAVCFKAAELVFAKSVSLPKKRDIAAVQSRRLIDSHFYQLAKSIPRVGWINLRQQQEIEPWLELGKPVGSKRSL